MPHWLSTSELIILIISGAISTYVIVSNIKLWKDNKKFSRGSRDINKRVAALNVVTSLAFYLIAIYFLLSPMETLETKSMGEIHYWVAGALLIMAGWIFDLLAVLEVSKISQKR
ncbi:hypothetical protein HON22_04190 [Candidatus Peregrinibacteria bacterium]|jgi:hypothetical protein|nr:hypothetical protein [Candidatus Peregrinibacteria bacterium]